MRLLNACSVVLPLLVLACSQSTPAPGSKPDFATEEKAIREMDARWLKAATTAWSTESIHIADSGDLAIQTGEYHTTGIGANGEREDKGRFVTVWKKVGGEWKVAHDIGSTTMAEAPPEKK